MNNKPCVIPSELQRAYNISRAFAVAGWANGEKALPELLFLGWSAEVRAERTAAHA
jgi:hypothetical protein